MINLSDVRLSLIGHEESGELRKLLDQYLEELRNHREIPVGAVDTDSYTYLPLYWKEPGRHPFFILSRETRQGFVLIRENSQTGVTELSEFYICPQARRRGMGQTAVAEIWRMFPGSWKLQVHLLNKGASAFWLHCIKQHAIGDIRVQDVMAEDGRRIQYNFKIDSR